MLSNIKSSNQKLDARRRPISQSPSGLIDPPKYKILMPDHNCELGTQDVYL